MLTFDEGWGSLGGGERGNGGERSHAGLVAGTDPEVVFGVLFKPSNLVVLVGATVHLVEPGKGGEEYGNEYGDVGGGG